MSLERRCAIYTRKSTEEGLEQDFNSLQAQREACEAFIRSQRQEGWRALAEAFDDGGYSGGSMDRPALARLLERIKASQVDIVVVYKVDRLTRSLADFAKMVELFDARGVSFVSVTQAFNTTTSMGRLTLNVLLSFAQFEREVTGERIRDKIAASKRKGIWMGGMPPLGYDVQDRALVANPAEAETVRALFRLYLELGTVRRVKEAADRMGLRTKRREDSSGQVMGGRPFSRGQLYRLLSSRLYVGEVTHNEAHHPGRHAAIIDREIFQTVQSQLAGSAARRRAATNGRAPSLLAGLVYDETGDRLCPTHANKKGRRYRYYISARLLHGSSDGGWRLPARELEGVVLQALREFLRDELRLSQALALSEPSPDHLRGFIVGGAGMADELERAGPERKRELLLIMLDSIKLSPESIRLEVTRSGLVKAIGTPASDLQIPDGAFQVEMAIRLRRRGVEARLVLRAGPEISTPDSKLVAVVAQAHRWIEDLASGRAPSVRALARRDHRDAAEICRTLPLTFLAPDVIEAILVGRQPVELTPQKLRRIGVFPSAWEDQLICFGFRSRM